MPIKALLFDLMGTCCDWRSSIEPLLSSTPALSSRLPTADLQQLAVDWRAGFFEEIHARFHAGEGQEDIDITHRRVLDRLLEQLGITGEECGERERRDLVIGWHSQIG